MKTDQQRLDEVNKLRELRGQVPPRTAFGDSNLDRIDAQIKVIENNMTGRQIDDEFEDEDLHDEAMLAREWLDGGHAEPPSSDWETLRGVKVKALSPHDLRPD